MHRTTRKSRRKALTAGLALATCLTGAVATTGGAAAAEAPATAVSVPSLSVSEAASATMQATSGAYASLNTADSTTPQTVSARVSRPSVTKIDWHRVQGYVTNGVAGQTVYVDIWVGDHWSPSRVIKLASNGTFETSLTYGQGSTGRWAIRARVIDRNYKRTVSSKLMLAYRTAMPSPYTYGRDSSGVPTNPQPLPYAPAAIKPVPAWQWQMIVATGTWRAGSCPGSRSAFRRVEVPYYGFDGQTHRGAITVRWDVANSTAAFFNSMYAQRFPIQRVDSVEAFGGWDLQSEKANNTSAQNCRKPSEANAPQWQSPHANGRAMDINTYRNPWLSFRTGKWEPSSYWTGARRTMANEVYGVIMPGGKPYQFLTSHGWNWQGWAAEKDYQHFDTGYPSVYKPGY